MMLDDESMNKHENKLVNTFGNLPSLPQKVSVVSPVPMTTVGVPNPQNEKSRKQKQNTSSD